MGRARASSRSTAAWPVRRAAAVCELREYAKAQWPHQGERTHPATSRATPQRRPGGSADEASRFSLPSISTACRPALHASNCYRHDACSHRSRIHAASRCGPTRHRLHLSVASFAHAPEETQSRAKQSQLKSRHDAILCGKPMNVTPCNVGAVKRRHLQPPVRLGTKSAGTRGIDTRPRSTAPTHLDLMLSFHC